MKRKSLYAVFACFLTTPVFPTDRYDFIPDESSIAIHVPRAGLLSLFGHDHDIEASRFEGFLSVDHADLETSRIVVRILTKDLRIVDEGVPEETRSKIDAEMRSENVLHEHAHAEIVFESSDISVENPDHWSINGELTIRGVTRPVVFAAKVRFPSESRLDAAGEVKLKPIDFGIEPVRALGGAVRTASTIDIRFHIAGTQEKG